MKKNFEILMRVYIHFKRWADDKAEWKNTHMVPERDQRNQIKEKMGAEVERAETGILLGPTMLPGGPMALGIAGEELTTCPPLISEAPLYP